MSVVKCWRSKIFSCSVLLWEDLNTKSGSDYLAKSEIGTSLLPTFYHFEYRALLESFDVLELGKVIEGRAVELEWEASPVTRLLLVDEDLVDLLHQLHRTHLHNDIQSLPVRTSDAWKTNGHLVQLEETAGGVATGSATRWSQYGLFVKTPRREANLFARRKYNKMLFFLYRD